MATTTDTLRLRVGGRYKTRDGRAVEIVQHDPISTPWVFWGYVETGRFSWKLNGSYFDEQFHDLDLISEIKDDAPVYRYFRYRDAQPYFSGQDMRWRVTPGGRPEACDLCDGTWRTSAHTDEASLEASHSLIECDADGNPLEPEAPEYRYFADRVDDTLLTVWRVSPDGRVEAKHYGKDGDPWETSGLSNPRDFDNDEYFECDVDRNPIQTPEPEPAPTVSFKTTEDLTPGQRTRIAKLAARIVLADGPVLTVDELAGLTVWQLVCKLENVTDIYSI